METTHQPAQVIEAPSSSGKRVLLNTGALTGSSMWRILVSFVLQLVVARQLGFAALGHYTVALAYLNVCQVLSELGLQALLVRNLAQSPQKGRHAFFQALWLQLGASLVVWLGLVIVVPFVFTSPVMQLTVTLVGATLPFYAVTTSCQTLFQARERMELVMMVEMAVNTLIGLLSILAIWAGGNVFHLVLVLILTQLISAILCVFLLGREEILGASIRERSTRSGQLLREAAPFYGLSLADVLLQRLDILLLSAFGGETITGIYSAAYNVVRILLKLIQSFWKALYPTFSRLIKTSHRRYVQLSEMSLRFALALLIMCATIGTGSAEHLLHIVYGRASSVSVLVFQILVWIGPLFLIELYAITLLMVEKRAAFSLVPMGAHLASVMLLLPALTLRFGAVGAASAVLVSSLIGALVSLLLLRYFQMPFSMSQGVRILFPAVVTLLASIYVPLTWPVGIASSVGIYLVLLWLCGIVSVAELHRFGAVLLGKTKSVDQ